MSIWNPNLHGILYSRDSSIFLIKGHSKFPQFPMKGPEVEETELDGRRAPTLAPPFLLEIPISLRVEALAKLQRKDYREGTCSPPETQKAFTVLKRPTLGKTAFGQNFHERRS